MQILHIFITIAIISALTPLAPYSILTRTLSGLTAGVLTGKTPTQAIGCPRGEIILPVIYCRNFQVQ
jgi:hypothetical protein